MWKKMRFFYLLFSLKILPSPYFLRFSFPRKLRRGISCAIIGPQASILIQGIVTLMYTVDRSARPIIHGLYNHPALSEVVEGAFTNLMRPAVYHEIPKKHFPQQ